jgi:tetratricopeptide (TPR) repeat protein
LGRLHHAAGRPGPAATHHQRALELATRLGQPADQARAHDGLGHAHRAQDQPDQARHHWQQALGILAALGTDYTEDEEASAPAIRAHLADLDRSRGR